MGQSVCALLDSRRVDAPADSLIADWYPSAYLLDIYSVALSLKGADVRSLAQQMLEQPPRWFRVLLSIRDAVMGRLGVKTTDQVRAAHVNGQRLDFFPVALVTTAGLTASDYIAKNRRGYVPTLQWPVLHTLGQRQPIEAPPERHLHKMLHRHRELT